MQRIMIIGGPGAGKSWLADELSRSLDLPLIAVDGLVWRVDGSLRPAHEIDADALAAAQAERWIIEGGNSRTYGQRLARADMLVRLAPPRWLRLWRVLRRNGLRLRLLEWAWRYDGVFGPRDADLVRMAQGGIIVHELASANAVQRFLAQIKTGQSR